MREIRNLKDSRRPETFERSKNVNPPDLERKVSDKYDSARKTNSDQKYDRNNPIFKLPKPRQQAPEMMPRTSGGIVLGAYFTLDNPGKPHAIDMRGDQLYKASFRYWETLSHEMMHAYGFKNEGLTDIAAYGHIHRRKLFDNLRAWKPTIPRLGNGYTGPPTRYSLGA